VALIKVASTKAAPLIKALIQETKAALTKAVSATTTHTELQTLGSKEGIRVEMIVKN